MAEPMTLTEAIAALLGEFELESYVDVVREDAREDESFTGVSWEHPKVQRFQAVCQRLRAHVVAAASTATP